MIADVESICQLQCSLGGVSTYLIWIAIPQMTTFKVKSVTPLNHLEDGALESPYPGTI